LLTETSAIGRGAKQGGDANSAWMMAIIMAVLALGGVVVASIAVLHK